MSPRKYIEMLLGTYKHIFGSKPKQYVISPLEKGDHPEQDMSEELDADGIKDNQLLISAPHWSVSSLGRIDITTAVMTISGFRVVPRKGYLEQVQHIISYLIRWSILLSGFALKNLISLLCQTSSLTWPIISMAVSKKLFYLACPLLWESFVILTHYVDTDLYHAHHWKICHWHLTPYQQDSHW